MSEELTFAERYMTARSSSNLKSDPRTRMSATDILTASGLSGAENDLAHNIWVLIHKPTIGRLQETSDALAVRLGKSKVRCKSPRYVARTVLLWHLNKTCKTCDGLGKMRIAGTPHLSDDTCLDCGGSGERPLTTGEPDAVQWLLREIKGLSEEAEIAMKNRIK